MFVGGLRAVSAVSIGRGSGWCTAWGVGGSLLGRWWRDVLAGHVEWLRAVCGRMMRLLRVVGLRCSRVWHVSHAESISNRRAYLAGLDYNISLGPADREEDPEVDIRHRSRRRTADDLVSRMLSVLAGT